MLVKRIYAPQVLIYDEKARLCHQAEGGETLIGMIRSNPYWTGEALLAVCFHAAIVSGLIH